MKHSILYNLLTSLAILLCISCAHQGKKSAAMEDDVTQEVSSTDSESPNEERNLTSLDVQKDANTEKEEAPSVVAAPSNPNPPEASAASVETSNVESEKKSEPTADNKELNDSITAMVQMGMEDVPQMAAEEEKRVEVVPTVTWTPPTIVASSEDTVNADASANDSTRVDTDREPSNDSNAKNSNIETEPVPAPAKKFPKKQGSEGKARKSRIVKVEEVVAPVEAKEQAVAIQAAPVVQPVQAPVVVAKQVVKEEKKPEPKLASAEIATFMSEHYLAMGVLILLAAFLAFRFMMRSSKPDENFPL